MVQKFQKSILLEIQKNINLWKSTDIYFYCFFNQERFVTNNGL